MNSFRWVAWIWFLPDTSAGQWLLVVSLLGCCTEACCCSFFCMYINSTTTVGCDDVFVMCDVLVILSRHTAEWLANDDDDVFIDIHLLVVWSSVCLSVGVTWCVLVDSASIHTPFTPTSQPPMLSVINSVLVIIYAMCVCVIKLSVGFKGRLHSPLSIHLYLLLDSMCGGEFHCYHNYYCYYYHSVAIYYSQNAFQVVTWYLTSLPNVTLLSSH